MKLTEVLDGHLPSKYWICVQYSPFFGGLLAASSLGDRNKLLEQKLLAIRWLLKLPGVLPS